MTPECRKGLKPNGLEYDGNRCRRRCSVNNMIETARKVHCRCGHVGQKCQYFVNIRGRFRPFNENLSAQCEPKISLRNSLQIFSSTNEKIIPKHKKHKKIEVTAMVPNTHYTNHCGPRFNQGIPESGCWRYNPTSQKCEIKNPDCLKLNCHADKMSLFLRKDVFLGLSDFTKLLSDNSSATCSADNIGKKNSQSYSFDITFGSCGMKTEVTTRSSHEYIRFTQTMSYKTMEVNFMCLFPKNQGIASKSPVGDLTPDGIEQIALWENFDLSFGRQSLSIGDRITAVIQWEADLKFTDVLWYLDKCSVHGEKNSFDVVSDGCYSSLVNTRMLSKNIANAKNFVFSFESFSFDENMNSELNFRLDCKINFCLAEACPRKSVPKPSCPKYYTNPHF